MMLSIEETQSMKEPAVYIMANQRCGTLYTGVTSNLIKRVWQHRELVIPGFTSEYGCKTLVWYELHQTLECAIVREKQIKAGSRLKKLALIEGMNPTWRDLYGDLVGGTAALQPFGTPT
jgi:putative endonuclease